MESQLVAPHRGHDHAHEVDPHSAGLHTDIEGEEKHHDEKPDVMSKVKEKVKKIKNKFGKKKQDDEEIEVEEDGYKEDDDSKISSTPTSEPQTISTGDAKKFEPEKVQSGDVIGDVKEDPAAPKSTDPPARASEPQRVSIGDAEIFEPEKVQSGDVIGDVKEDPTPKSTYPPARASEPQRVSIGDVEMFEPEKVQSGDVIGDVKEDPAAPKSIDPPTRASKPQRVSIGDADMFEPEKVQSGDVIRDVKEDPAAPKSTDPPARGGEDIGMTPVIQSFEAISVSNEPKPELEPKPETQTSDATGSTDQSNVSYTEKLKSMATVQAEYGKNIASTVYDKLSNAGTAVVQKIRGGPTKEVNTETNREVNQDKGVSVKEYLSEKLKPGEEDQALSEVISEAVQRSKEEMKPTEEVAQTKAGGTSVVGGGDGR